MRPVSDAFLLNMAEVSGSLIGLFLVGVFFFIDSGLRSLSEERRAFETYLRSGIRITLIVFAFPLGISLTLVVLDPVWSRGLFLILSVMLVAANYDSAVRMLAALKGTRSFALFLNEIVTTSLALTLLITPWALGGLHPTREHLTWAILLAFAAGFISIIATVMAAFEVAAGEPARLEAQKVTARPRRRGTTKR